MLIQEIIRQRQSESGNLMRLSAARCIQAIHIEELITLIKIAKLQLENF